MWLDDYRTRCECINREDNEFIERATSINNYNGTWHVMNITFDFKIFQTKCRDVIIMAPQEGEWEYTLQSVLMMCGLTDHYKLIFLFWKLLSFVWCRLKNFDDDDFRMIKIDLVLEAVVEGVRNLWSYEEKRDDNSGRRKTVPGLEIGFPSRAFRGDTNFTGSTVK